MILFSTIALFAEPPPPGGLGDFVRSPIFPVFLIMPVMLFFMMRSQTKKAKEHEAMLKTVKPGDKVVTASGIIGTIISVKDKSLSLRSADTKLEILKSAVTEITERNSAEAKEA